MDFLLVTNNMNIHDKLLTFYLRNHAVHISRNGGHKLFFVIPHFWYVCKACNASRCTLLKKMKKSHVDYEIFENQKSRLAIPINSLNVL